jgi:hypothetical protein
VTSAKIDQEWRASTPHGVVHAAAVLRRAAGAPGLTQRARRAAQADGVKRTSNEHHHEVLPVDGHIVVSLFLKGSKKKELVRELADQPASQAITLI